MDSYSWLVVLAFASLLLELVVFPIPSEASTYQLMFEADDDQPRDAGDDLRRARAKQPLTKVLVYFLPTALGVACFLSALAAAFVPGLVEHLFPVEALRTPGVRLAGAALVLVGRGITFGSVLQMRGEKRSGPFAARGLFRVSRNPGLVGMYLLYLGLSLIFPSWILFAGFAPYVLNMHRRVLMEESHLAEVIGPPYRDYLATVPRYVPFLAPGLHAGGSE